MLIQKAEIDGKGSGRETAMRWTLASILYIDLESHFEERVETDSSHTPSRRLLREQTLMELEDRNLNRQ